MSNSKQSNAKQTVEQVKHKLQQTTRELRETTTSYEQVLEHLEATANIPETSLVPFILGGLARDVYSAYKSSANIAGTSYLTSTLIAEHDVSLAANVEANVVANPEIARTISIDSGSGGVDHGKSCNISWIFDASSGFELGEGDHAGKYGYPGSDHLYLPQGVNVVFNGLMNFDDGHYIASIPLNAIDGSAVYEPYFPVKLSPAPVAGADMSYHVELALFEPLKVGETLTLTMQHGPVLVETFTINGTGASLYTIAAQAGTSLWASITRLKFTFKYTGTGNRLHVASLKWSGTSLALPYWRDTSTQGSYGMPSSAITNLTDIADKFVLLSFAVKTTYFGDVTQKGKLTRVNTAPTYPGGRGILTATQMAAVKGYESKGLIDGGFDYAMPIVWNKAVEPIGESDFNEGVESIHYSIIPSSAATIRFTIYYNVAFISQNMLIPTPFTPYNVLEEQEVINFMAVFQRHYSNDFHLKEIGKELKNLASKGFKWVASNPKTVMSMLAKGAMAATPLLL